MNWGFYKQQFHDYIHSQREQGQLWWLWIVLLPVAPLIAYMCLGFLKILPATDGIPRHLYIVVGVTSWLLFTDAIVQPYKSTQKYRAYFVRREISFTHLLSAWLPERFLSASLQFGFCLVFVFWTYAFTFLDLLTFGVINLAGFVLFLSIGAVLGVIGLISTSVTNLVEVSNRFLLFLSAVIFPLPSNPYVDLIKILNPYYVFVDNARLALFGQPVDWVAIVFWTAVGLLVSLFLAGRLAAITPDVRDYLF